MKRLVLFALACTLGWASAAEAQVLTGTILGTVKDDTGAVLPGVTLTLTSEVIPGRPATTVTNDKGEYRFGELRPGTYELSATISGFTNYKEEGLQVAVGGTTERNIALKVGAVSETITVSGKSPMVDTEKVGVTANLGEQALDDLPTHRFQTLEYAKWAPGVLPTDPAGSGSSVSVMGSAVSENSLLMDGTQILHPGSGSTWGSGDLDAIEEMQTVTLGASAEYQVAQGGVFSAVMRSGTNTFSGDGSAWWFPDSLVTKPIKINCNCSLGTTGFTNLQFRDDSGHLGGPIIHDKMWFYGGANYNQKIITNPGFDYRLQSSQPFYSHATFAKVTWQINNSLKVFGAQWNDWWGGQVFPTIQAPYATQSPQFGLVRSYSGEADWVISKNTLLLGRITGFLDPNYPQKALDGDTTTPWHTDLVTGITCCGVQSFGVLNVGRRGQAVKLTHYVQGSRVEHNIKGGVQLEQAESDSTMAYPSGVQYLDSAGQPNEAQYRSPFISAAAYHTYGVWGEDQMKISGRLTVTIGFRFDHMQAISPDVPAVNNQLQPTGATIKGLGNMFVWKEPAPRMGFNLKLTEDAKTVLRGDYGRAYRSIFLNDFQNVYPGLSPITLDAWVPATNSYSRLISVTNPIANLAVDPNLKAPYTDMYSIGLDRELMKNTGVGISYVHKHGLNQVGWTDIGGIYTPQTVTLPNGQPLTVLALQNATSARRFFLTNGPGFYNKYDGIILQLSKRLSDNWSASASYTHSKSQGLFTNPGSTTGQDPNAYVNAAGLLSTDRPNVFTLTGAYVFPRIGVVSTINYMYAQGNPFAPQAVVRLPQGSTTVNIAPPDGTYRFPNQNLLNFKFTKELFRRGRNRLELSAEILNVLQNEANETIISQNFFATTFNQPSTWIEPRRADFDLRVVF
jgi:hypothetical protein